MSYEETKSIPVILGEYQPQPPTAGPFEEDRPVTQRPYVGNGERGIHESRRDASPSVAARFNVEEWTMKQKPHAPKPKPKAKTGGSLVLDVDGSTCLSDARWSAKTKELAVTFARTGAQYVYQDVPRSVAAEIDGGEAFNDLIWGNYSYD